MLANIFNRFWTQLNKKNIYYYGQISPVLAFNDNIVNNTYCYGRFSPVLVCNETETLIIISTNDGIDFIHEEWDMLDENNNISVRNSGL